MKYLKQFFIISAILLFALLFYKCSTNTPEEFDLIPYEEIELKGMDEVSQGGKLEVVIRSQKEYDELIYQRFQKPLDDYWKANYESVLQYVKERNPGLTDEEYENLVRQYFYSTPPFKGTEKYIHPKIDFTEYTLLGQDAHSGGCELPNYKIDLEKRGIDYIYRIFIKRNGNCDIAILKNKWIIINKISTRYKVKFEKIKN